MLQACVAVALAAVARAPGLLADDQPPLVPLDDMVFVRADSAVQSLSGDRVDAAGNLLLRSAAWTIHADSAIIEGPLADPLHIDVAGSPARIVYQEGTGDDPVEGYSERLRFEPRDEIVELEGSARIQREGRSISSDSIRYLLGQETFSAGRRGRVKVVTTPD
ncbi:MAG: LptA/OstA family protein [Gammaproteobacteria bacterium]